MRIIQKQYAKSAEIEMFGFGNERKGCMNFAR
jgi:hypothetical protein